MGIQRLPYSRTLDLDFLTNDDDFRSVISHAKGLHWRYMEGIKEFDPENSTHRYLWGYINELPRPGQDIHDKDSYDPKQYRAERYGTYAELICTRMLGFTTVQEIYPTTGRIIVRYCDAIDDNKEVKCGGFQAEGMSIKLAKPEKEFTPRLFKMKFGAVSAFLAFQMREEDYLGQFSIVRLHGEVSIASVFATKEDGEYLWNNEDSPNKALLVPYKSMVVPDYIYKKLKG